MLTPWKESYDQPRKHIKKQRHYFANKGPSSEGHGFSSGHVRMWELDYKESWAPKNWCFWTVVLEKTLESPLDCKEIQPVHPKGDQSWVFIGKTDTEVSASTSVLPMDTQDWSPLGWTGWISLLFKGLSRVFPNTTVQKHQIIQHSAFFIIQLSHPYMTTGKTTALTMDLCQQSDVSTF